MGFYTPYSLSVCWSPLSRVAFIFLSSVFDTRVLSLVRRLARTSILLVVVWSGLLVMWSIRPCSICYSPLPLFPPMLYSCLLVSFAVVDIRVRCFHRRLLPFGFISQLSVYIYLLSRTCPSSSSSPVVSSCMRRFSIAIVSQRPFSLSPCTT